MFALESFCEAWFGSRSVQTIWVYLCSIDADLTTVTLRCDLHKSRQHGHTFRLFLIVSLSLSNTFLNHSHTLVSNVVNNIRSIRYTASDAFCNKARTSQARQYTCVIYRMGPEKTRCWCMDVFLMNSLLTHRWLHVRYLCAIAALRTGINGENILRYLRSRVWRLESTKTSAY